MMRKPILKSQKGFTMIEVATVSSILAMILLATVSMMMASIRTFDSASTRTYTDTDAVIAMQNMVNDVREAKKVLILDDSKTLRIVPPETSAEGYYNRFLESANYIEYYRSDSSGTKGIAGNWLWRCTAEGVTKVVRKDVTSVKFEVDTARSIMITIITKNSAKSGCRETKLTQRVVYLRNY